MERMSCVAVGILLAILAWVILATLLIGAYFLMRMWT